MSFPNPDALIRNLRSYFVGHGEYYGVDPAWHDHSKLVASDGLPDPALSADANGYISAAVQPLFSAYLSATVNNVTGDNTNYTVIFDTEITDRNSNYNNATGVFTAPVDGSYLLIPNVYLEDIAAAHDDARLRVITSNRNYTPVRCHAFSCANVNGELVIAGSVIADMDSGDTASVQIRVSGGGLVVDVTGAAGAVTFFQGYLLI